MFYTLSIKTVFKKKKFANFFNGLGHGLSESGRIDSQKNQIGSRVNPFSDRDGLGQKILTCLAMSSFTSSFIIIIILGGKREGDRQVFYFFFYYYYYYFGWKERRRQTNRPIDIEKSSLPKLFVLSRPVINKIFIKRQPHNNEIFLSIKRYIPE